MYSGLTLAQTNTSATYNTGLISSDFGGVVVITQNSNCPGALTVPVPAGRFVTGVRVEYDFEALGNNWQTEQSSYLECVTTSTKEGSVTTGPPINGNGTVSYDRSNLNLANGVVPVGGLQFRLHGWRSFTAGGCTTTSQRILNNTFKVTVTHIAPPTCFQPTAPSLNSITTNSASVDWTTGGATDWEVEYGLAGFSPGSGTRLAVTSAPPYTINGLLPSTDYEFVVRDSCGSGDVSIWSIPFAFRTGCSTIAAPWNEDFESSVWDPTATFLALGDIDTCFTRNFTNNFTWKAGPPIFPPFNSGPSGDHTTGSGKYAFSERITFGTFPTTATLTTPPIDLGPLTVPEFTFWYHMFGPDVNRLEVLLSTDGVAFTSIFVKTGQQQTAKTDSWLEGLVNLSSYTNDTVILRFEVTQNTFGGSGDIAIDDIDIKEAPTCPRPTNLNFSASTFNSITLDWTTGGASNWQIEYGAVGFTQGAGTVVNANSNPFTITGLSANTEYDFYVRDSCSATDKSTWTSVTLGKTTCNPVAAPYTENFDGTIWTRGANAFALGTIDNCWNRDVIAHVFKSGPPTFSSNFTGTSVDHTLGTVSGKYLQAERIGVINGDVATATSVPIDLSALTVPELSFWYHMFGSDIGTLEVFISNDGGANFTQEFILTGQSQTSNTDAWKEAVVNISAYANDTILIRFVSTSLNFAVNADLGIDDVDIHEQPSCPKPQSLVTIGQTNSTATLQWTSGGATNWNIEYGSVGFTIGSGTLVNANTNPFTITSLSASTTYEFYIRDSCGIADVSDWIGPIQITTDCNPVSAPYTENFDGPTFTIGAFPTPGNLDPCWFRDGTVNYQMVPLTTTTTFSSGPTSDHTTGTGKFLAAQRFFGTLTASRIGFIESPIIDLTSLTVPELTFWYHMFGVDIDSLQVEVFDGSTWKREGSVTGSQQTSKTDAWQELLVDISAYANDSIKLRFNYYRNTVFGFNSAIAIDDVDIHEQPTCPQPSNLSVTSTSANSATLSWTTGGASNWQIEYGPAGFTSGSGTIVNAPTNPFTVINLNSSTTYDFFVRDSCSATDVSFWLGRTTASTTCLPLLAPYTENFDGSTWLTGPNFNDTGSIAQCWARNPLADYFWKSGPPIFISTFTGPSSDHTTGTGKYIFAETSFGGGTPPFDAFIESPPIDLSALTAPELTFWYHMFGNDIGTVSAEIDDGSGYTQVWTRTGAQQTSGNDAWKEAVLSLSAYANDTIRIRFKATKPAFGFAADAAIDDVQIDEAPSCPKPQNFTIVGKTNTTVTLQWSSGGASDWNIEYGNAGFSLGSGTLLNVTNNPFTVTGLSANTDYEFYVRDSCGVADVSDWIGPIGDTTDCNPVSAPYTENFDGSVWVIGGFFSPGSIDPCWDRDASRNYVWSPEITTTPFNSGPTADHTSGTGKFLFTQRLFGTATPTTNANIVSPLVDLAPLTIPELTFWYHAFGADIDSLTVEVFNGTIWQREWSISGSQQTAKADPWIEATVNISAYANDTIKVRIKGYRNSTFAFNSAVAIDDFDIHEQPSCPKPSALAVTSTSSNSVTLSWTTGGATNWQIEYGSAGFSPGSGTIVNANTNPFTVNLLNSSTTYEFYVRDSCSATDVSAWLGPILASTDCLPLLAPFTEDFEGPSWTSGPNFNDTGSVAQCWARTPLTDYFWRTGPPPFVNNFTGPSGDHTTGSGKYIFAESVFGGGAAPFDAFIETPIIDLSPLTTPELVFWYHMFGTGIGSLTVEVDDGSGYTQVWTKSGQQQTAGTDPWQEAIISLSSYVNDTIQVRFKATKATFTTLADAAVDDVSIKEAPSCPRPSAITTTNTTNTSITISWTTGGATNWLVGYRTAGSTGPLTIVPAGTNPFTISSLSPSTSYDIYVKDSCGAADVSDWEGPYTESTDCGVAIAPWSENFNGATWVSGANFDNAGNQINSCWSRPNATNPNFGTRLGPTTSNSGPSADFSGSGKYVYTEASGGATGAGEITSPWIYIPSNLVNPRFKFAYHMFGNGITSLTLQIDNGGGFGANVNTKTGAQHISNVDPWKVDSVMLTAYSGDTIRFKFTGTNSGFNGDIAVDEVAVVADPNSPTCTDPINLNITAITPTGFTVNWTGNGNSYVEVVPTGQPQGSGTLYPNVVSPLVVTSLLSLTNYDIYIQDSCGVGVYSQWVDTTQSTLACPAISASFTNSNNWLGASFNSAATSNSDSLYWTFGDGNSSSTANPANNYAAAGVYVVTMNAFSDCGSTGQFIDTITICDTLKADFTFTQVGDTVQFDASNSSNATSYSWDLNGFGASGQQVNYKFPSPGTKPVTLTAYNDCGDSISITQNVSVCLAPVASWTYNIISTTSSGMLTQFDASASQNATSYEWDFGDGSPVVTGQVMPQHNYITPGLFYLVTLKVTNTCNDVNVSSFRLNQISIDEWSDIGQSIELFPNPASKNVFIQWETSDVSPTKMQLIDAAGRIIFERQISSNGVEEFSFDVSSLSSGYYLVKVLSDKGIKEFKLLKD